MSDSHHLSRLVTKLASYLRRLEEQGVQLPSTDGRVLNWTHVAAESGLPVDQLQEEPLHTACQNAVDRLGLECITPPPYAPQLTLNAEQFSLAFTAGRSSSISAASLPGYLSALNMLLKFHALNPGQPVAVKALDPASDFLKRYLKLRNDKSVRSKLNVLYNFASTLPSVGFKTMSFTDALQFYLERSGRACADVARDVDQHEALLQAWVSGERRPTLLDEVRRLEQVLHTPADALLQPFVRIGGLRTDGVAPLEMWPQRYRGRGGQNSHIRGRIVDLMPSEMQVASPAERQRALQLAIDDYESGRHRTPHGQRLYIMCRVKSYGLAPGDFSSHSQQEFAALRDAIVYGPATGQSVMRLRGVRRVSIATENMKLSIARYFCSWLALPVSDDPQLSGAHLHIEDISLAYLLLPDMVEAYIEFRRERSGVYNESALHVINLVSQLLQPRTGYLWATPELEARLPAPARARIAAEGGWRAMCASTAAHIADLRRLLRPHLERSRDVQTTCRGVLQLDRPLDAINDALTLHLEQLRAMPRDRIGTALQWRQYVLMFILSRLALRASHWGQLTYRDDGTGSLRRNDQGEWELHVPMSQFKNSSSGAFARRAVDEMIVVNLSRERAFERLIPHLEEYVIRYLPLLIPKDAQLFPAQGGATFTPRALQQAVGDWTRRFLSWRSRQGLQLRNQHPTGPHAFRTIIVTHVYKTSGGDIQAAADANLDHVRTLQRAYLNPSERISVRVTNALRHMR